MLKKEETVQNLAERAMENKLIATLKERMNVETKNVSVEEFTKMLTPPAEQTDEEKADEAAAESIAETAAETAPQAEVPEKKAKKTARKKSDEPEPGLF
jgi:trigger factor